MKIGFTCGTFDLLHAGHVAMLEECKRFCDKLIVAVQVDPSIDRSKKNKPIQSLGERFIQLRACKFVDEVIAYQSENDLVNLLSTIDIDIRFIGEDWKGKEITGEDECLNRYIHIHYITRNHNFSSSELRERIKKAK